MYIIPHRKHFLLLILLLTTVIGITAQSISDLKKQLANASNSKQKMTLNYELGKAYMRRDAEMSIKHHKNAHRWAVDLKEIDFAAEAAFQVSRGYNRENDARNEEIWLKSAFKTAKQADNPDIIIKSVDKLSRLVISKDRRNGHRKAYNYAKEAFDYFATKGDESISDFKSRVERSKANLERERKRLEKERKNLDLEIERLTFERNNLKSNNSKLTEKQRILEQEKEAVEQEIAEKDIAIEAVAKEKDRARRKVRKQASQISDLEAKRLLQEEILLNQEMELKLAEQEKHESQIKFFFAIGASILLVLLALTNYFKFLNKKKSNAQLAQQNQIIEEERQRSDDLLRNILPAAIAKELKETGKATARQFPEATVIFVDFKNFTKIAEKLSPEKLVHEIDNTFRAFDFIISQYEDIEKIKTIGDAYMAASGLSHRKSVPYNIVKAASEIQEYLNEVKAEKAALNEPYFEARIGLHTGPVVAGVVGNKKFAYDIWGDTVNIASRMEQNSEVGRVNMSGVTAKLVQYKYPVEYRGKLNVKNKGMMDMYYLKNGK